MEDDNLCTLVVFLETAIQRITSQALESYQILEDFIDSIQFDEISWLFGTLLVLPKNATFSDLKQMISTKTLPAKYNVQ